MQHLRIEYPSSHAEGMTMCIPVPDVATALVVAQINHPDGAVQLWDGERQLAVLHRQQGDLSPLWAVVK